MTLCLQQLKERMRYDAESGVFYWLVSAPPAKIGDVAGSPMSAGYWSVTVFGKRYLAHRLAWFYMTGEWPSTDIDHINRDKRDNRWSNLRTATESQNIANSGMRRNNTSGFKNVYWNRRRKKWYAVVKVAGRSKHLGSYSDLAEASRVAADAARAHFGEFANV